MRTHNITNAQLAEIRSIIDPQRILYGEEISSDYSHDELGDVYHYPEVIIRVHSTQEVSNIMKYAYQQNIPVVVRGSGTGLVGAAVAVQGGIMLETTQMNQILDLDMENLTIDVQPGVLLMDLADYVQDRNLFYPPDPGEKSATIGGNISTNAGGMRAVKYGVTRDYVRGLTVVLPDGRVLELGGKVVKNSSGYSLKDLIIGSEGTLGVITQATLKLLPLPSCSISLLVPFESMEKALEVVPKLIRIQVSPTAIEYMSRDTILFAEEYLCKRFPDTRSEAYILLTFDGNSMQQVEFEYDRAAKLCLENDALDVFIVDTDERKASVWSARGAFLEAIKASTTQMDECDVVVPRNRIADFIKYTHQLAKDLDIRIPSFGHAGDGNLHIYICRDNLEQERWQEKLTTVFDAMYTQAALYMGQVSGEHGIGYAKRTYLHRQLGDDTIGVMRGIKQVFDPKNLLNPQKVI